MSERLEKHQTCQNPRGHPFNRRKEKQQQQTEKEQDEKQRQRREKNNSRKRTQTGKPTLGVSVTPPKVTETLSGETRQGEPKATTGQQRREENVLTEKRRDTMRVKKNYRRKKKTLGKREAAFQGPPRARNAGKQKLFVWLAWCRGS